MPIASASMVLPPAPKPPTSNEGTWLTVSSVDSTNENGHLEEDGKDRFKQIVSSAALS